MKKIILLIVLNFSLITFAQNLQQKMSEKEKVSYAIGIDVGRSFNKVGLKNKDLDFNYFLEGVKNVVNGEVLKMSPDSLYPFIQEYMEKIQRNMQDSLGKINIVKSQEFLAKNKSKKGIITTSSGLQYEIIKKGKGEKPKKDNLVIVKYEGKTIDGNVFDSTEKNNDGEAIEIPLDKVIKGWTEGIQLMNKGAKYRFYIPSDLAYGENAPPVIGPNQALIFDVELVDFKDNNTIEN